MNSFVLSEQMHADVLLEFIIGTKTRKSLATFPLRALDRA